jgi:exopolysaccharide biosynthesis polyprenyl glycosylphosphotransferase
MPRLSTISRFLYSSHGTRWRIWDFLVGMVAFLPGWFLSPYHLQRTPSEQYLVIMGALYGFILAGAARSTAVPVPESHASRYELLTSSIMAVIISYVLFMLPVSLFLVRAYGRYIVIPQIVIAFCGLFAPRFLLMGIMKRNPVNVVIYGAGKNGRRLLELIKGSNRFDCLGFLDTNTDLHEQQRDDTPPILGSIDSCGPDELQDLGTDLVIISVKAKNLLDSNARKITHLPLHNIEVLNKGAFIEKYFKKISVEYGCPQWFASTPSLPGNSSMFFFKRLLDILCVIPGLVISLPLWIPIAIGVKLSSPGPIFFVQKRVGYRGRIFTIIKFRTMGVDAEKDGAQWAVKKDPRVTWFGRFLRISRLDEIPQLINVLLGQMTLVGPRPERPEFVDELSKEIPYYDYRCLVPPGLTGWAQIKYRYGATKKDALRKLEYDLFYIRNISISLDIEIMLRTLPMIMKGSR